MQKLNCLLLELNNYYSMNSEENNLLHRQVYCGWEEKKKKPLLEAQMLKQPVLVEVLPLSPLLILIMLSTDTATLTYCSPFSVFHKVISKKGWHIKAKDYQEEVVVYAISMKFWVTIVCISAFTQWLPYLLLSVTLFYMPQDMAVSWASLHKKNIP